MPNKTIYVSDDDLPLFQRAQELVGGNLSGAIVTALRRFIEIEEGRLAGFDEITVRVGPEGARRQRFLGKPLGRLTRMTNDGVAEKYQVFLGRNGKFAVHVQRADWKRYEPGASGNWLKDLTGIGSWRAMLGISVPEWGDFELDVVDSLQEVRARVPARLYRMVADALDHPEVEDIDL